MFRLGVLAPIGVLICGGLLMPNLQASSVGEEITVTFDEPVAVPGHVLPAGNYLFRLKQSTSELNVVEIQDQQSRKVYGEFLVTPYYHSRPANKAAVVFEPRTPGSPEAIRAWFYPGDKYGYEFRYKK
jgi:hypothetical protein